MPNQEKHYPRKRTAVLVVHGMGSQRPLHTARDVVEAVWLEGKNRMESGRKIWTHHERCGTDIDLPVIVTSSVPNTDRRQVDFHELYWAHLMSETRAVAVLLWLFELARMGPRLKRSIKPLYWGALTFLALLVLSVSLLAIQFVILFVEHTARISTRLPTIDVEFRLLVFVALFTFFVVSCLIAAAAILQGASRLAAWSAVTAVIAFLIFAAAFRQSKPCPPELFEHLTNAFLPSLLALMAIKIMMGWWGVAGLGIAYGFSVIALAGFSLYAGSSNVAVCAGLYCWLPWSITSHWSSVTAWFFIAIYLALYALFLQPYLGDAARYFRDSPANVAVRREIRKEAVDTLEEMHLSGKYDRIVVVAHSLGTVIAYDMLRAYYSRVDRLLPLPQLLGPTLDVVDQGEPDRAEARKKGRAIIAEIEKFVAARKPSSVGAPHDEDGLRAWLVTDFVTMGSPLIPTRGVPDSPGIPKSATN
jgi:hypothetical protein